jgi:transmembrane sensor
MKTRVDRLNEASEWLLRLQESGRTEADVNDWLAWCDADPENDAAFEAVQRKWRELDSLKTPDSLQADLASSAIRNRAALVLDTPDALAPGGHSARLARSRRTTFGVAAGLAATLATLVVTVWVLRDQSTPSAPSPQQFAATVTHRAATLPDGSRMILGSKSLVRMDFNGDKRQLDLSSGRAYFQVKRDAQRPFVVQAGGVSITAIGTAFDVRRADDKVIVTVEEGTVEVSSEVPGKEPVTWRAEAGYQLTYSGRQRTAAIASINPATALTWRRGELAYLHETLGSVIEDLNRYSTRAIVIADPAVAELRFTGTAFAAELDGWLAGIEQAYPVDVQQSETGEIVLSTRD